MAEPPEKRPDENLETIRGISTDEYAPPPILDPTEPRTGASSAPAPSPDATPTYKSDLGASTEDFDHVVPTIPPKSPSPAGTPSPALALSIDMDEVDGCVPGQVLFGRYVVERQIGSGGMGTVWLVRHQTLGVHRALKLIRPQIAFDPKTRADFRREAMIMANLHHPNAVMVHDAQIGSELAYIEMEYLEGVSVEKSLSYGDPMPLDWVMRILDQLCRLLTFVHEKGVVHRDLKPSNLLLLDGRAPGDEFLKVLDFGIAKSLNPDISGPEAMQTGTGAARYTPHYASPEQVGGAKEIDGRSDLYSVGVILFEFLTGHRPFGEPGLIYQHLCTPAPAFKSRNPSCQVPPVVEAVVLRCLEKDPKNRPATAAELAREFFEAVEKSGYAPTLAVGTKPPSPRKTDPGRRNVVDKTGGPPASKNARLKVAAAFAALAGMAILWYVTGPGGKKSAEPIAGAPATTTAATGTNSATPTGRVNLGPGFEVDRNAKITLSGWPDEIVSTRTLKHYVIFDDGIYIPYGFSALDPKDLVGGWPRVLVRKSPVGQRFVRIQGGNFTMGGLLSDDVGPNEDPPSDTPAHEVALPDYYLQETEVTNAQYEEYDAEPNSTRAVALRDWVMKDPRSNIGTMANRAAGFVNHAEAAAYARFVGGRLPTEAEWEFAIRSRGRRRPFVWGDEPPNPELANYNSAELDRGMTIPIAKSGAYSKDRTAEGIVDLAGNQREWCYEPFLPYTSKSLVQPVHPDVPLIDMGDYVVRGGSWNTDADRLGVTVRTKEPMLQRAADLGFRVVLDVPPTMTQH